MKWTWFHNLGKKTQHFFIMLQIIALMIASTLFLHQYTSEVEEKEVTPTIGMLYIPCGDNNFTVHIERCNPGPIPVRLVQYTLLDDRGTPVPDQDGNLAAIYGLNFIIPETMITFYDNDRDGFVSPGDVIRLKSYVEGGVTNPGYSLLLRYVPTGEKMNGGGTKLA